MSTAEPGLGSTRFHWIAAGTATAVGVAVGVGAYTFVFAEGGSYLTDNPGACANCHIMNEQFDGWMRSSHRAVATCNDCHTPHFLFGKWFTKAWNGFHHSTAFTTQRFHEPIQIKPFNRAITEASCRSCHADVVHAIDRFPQPNEPLSCIRCHRDVGHLH